MRGLLTLPVSITTMMRSSTKQKYMPKQIISEFDLVSYLAEELKQEFKTDAFAREFSVGYGIADLVFARSFYARQNKLGRKPIDNYYSLMLYLSLQANHPFTTAEASNLLRVSRSIAGGAINSLVSDGYVTQLKHGSYAKTTVIEPEPMRLVAIEAKLKDWKQGILQARRYKAFTDESYLAILARYEKNIDPELLEAHDIGLILVDPASGSITFKRRPAGSRPQHMVGNAGTELYANELFLGNYRFKTV